MSLELARLVGRIDAALPQTQCTRCGYPDCMGYAEAIAAGLAAINQCPPGGAEGVHRLAAITGQPFQPLNPLHGSEGVRALAVIDEDWCIGCTLCIKACPTDAILGSNKHMHTVIAPWCTGCALCVPVCPVDCIAMEDASGTATGWQAWSPAQASAARIRYQTRRARLPPDITMPPAVAQPAGAGMPDQAAIAESKQSVIDAALARARALRANKPA